MTSRQLLLLIAVFPMTLPCGYGDELKITWYDPTCGFMLGELAEGYGLYQWKKGPEPKVGNVVIGDIAGGPPVEADLQPSGEKISMVHWADAKSGEVLLKHTPRGCLNKPKKK